jgi:CheY-like chemotaxis protein
MILPVYWPTTILVVDDDPEMLETIKLNLGSKFRLKCFTSPLKALRYLEENRANNSLEYFTNKYIQEVDEMDFAHKTFDVNFRAFHKELYNSERYNLISAVIIDYNMPEMDGLTFCAEAKSYGLSTILLTARLEKPEAVEAFNQSLIDKYIEKNGSKIYSYLETYLKDMQYKFFIQLVNEVSFNPIIFRNKAIAKIFDDIIQQYNIKEYYVLDAQGNYVLVDEDSNILGLFIQSEIEVKESYREAVYRKAPENVLKKLENDHYILCYHNSKLNIFPPTEEWSKYLFRADKVRGVDQNYYIAITKNNLDIDMDKLKLINK